MKLRWPSAHLLLCGLVPNRYGSVANPRGWRPPALGDLHLRAIQHIETALPLWEIPPQGGTEGSIEDAVEERDGDRH